ncbi:MAG: hypothetical protein ACI4I0_00370 [Acutalibacteraceae bacterium]
MLSVSSRADHITKIQIDINIKLPAGKPRCGAVRGVFHSLMPTLVKARIKPKNAIKTAAEQEVFPRVKSLSRGAKHQHYAAAQRTEKGGI